MRLLNYLFVLAVLFASCTQNPGSPAKTEQTTEEQPLPSVGNFGETITEENTLDVSSFLAAMSGADTMNVKVKGTVSSCCQHSGCWMDIDLENGSVMTVSFKDGAFVIPKDATGKTAVIEGTASKILVPVDRLKAYAKDEGKSEEEIAAITEPVWEYSFVARGVILQ